MSRHNLEHAARVICDGAGLADPQRFVVERLRRGVFRGLKVGRQWLMTDQQILDAIAQLEGTAAPQQLELEQPVGIVAGLSSRAVRRLVRSA